MSLWAYLIVHAPGLSADAKDHAGERTFRSAFAKSKHQPADHDGDERETRCDRAGEGRLQDLHGLRPG